MPTVKDFNECYDKVFNSDGSIKFCGRSATCDLIMMSMRISPGRNYGDVDTGFMKTDVIQELHTELNTK